MLGACVDAWLGWKSSLAKLLVMVSDSVTSSSVSSSSISSIWSVTTVLCVGTLGTGELCVVTARCWCLPAISYDKSKRRISINPSLPGDNPLLLENWNFVLDPKSHLSRNARAGDMSRARDSRESGRSFRVKIILLWLDCNLENIFHKTWNHTILHSFSQEAQWHWLPWRFSNKVVIEQGIHLSSLWSSPQSIWQCGAGQVMAWQHWQVQLLQYKQ